MRRGQTASSRDEHLQHLPPTAVFLAQPVAGGAAGGKGDQEVEDEERTSRSTNEAAYLLQKLFRGAAPEQSDLTTLLIIQSTVRDRKIE